MRNVTSPVYASHTHPTRLRLGISLVLAVCAFIDPLLWVSLAVDYVFARCGIANCISCLSWQTRSGFSHPPGGQDVHIRIPVALY